MIFKFLLFYIFHKIIAEDTESNVVRFDEIDLDANGRITFNELEKWHKENADNPNISDQKLKSFFQQYDKNRDGALSISEFVPMALVLTRKPIRQSEQLFKRVDKDGDGAITRTEALNSGDTGISREIIDGIFEVADFNHDGKITLNEFASIIDSDPTIGHPKTQEEKDRDLAQRLLSLIDQNGDRKLSPQEVHNFANVNAKVSESEVLQAFGYLDSNHDGFLSLKELVALPNKMVQLVHFEEPPPVTN